MYKIDHNLSLVSCTYGDLLTDINHQIKFFFLLYHIKIVKIQWFKGLKPNAFR